MAIGKKNRVRTSSPRVRRGNRRTMEFRIFALSVAAARSKLTALIRDVRHDKRVCAIRGSSKLHGTKEGVPCPREKNISKNAGAETNLGRLRGSARKKIRAKSGNWSVRADAGHLFACTTEVASAGDDTWGILRGSWLTADRLSTTGGSKQGGTSGRESRGRVRGKRQAPI